MTSPSRTVAPLAGHNGHEWMMCQWGPSSPWDASGGAFLPPEPVRLDAPDDLVLPEPDVELEPDELRRPTGFFGEYSIGGPLPPVTVRAPDDEPVDADDDEPTVDDDDGWTA